MDQNSHFSGKKTLITGGAGFIGSHLARRLCVLGAQVSIIDSMIPEYGGNLFNLDGIENQVKLNISDVRDEHSLRYLVQGQDYIFNLAGQTSHLDSMENPSTDLDINCRAQLSILEAVRKYNPKTKMVFASTRQLYGKPLYLPVDERHTLQPVDVNGINKLAGEGYHLLYNNIYNIPTCILRLTNTYGPCMRIKDSRQTFLGVWIRLIVEGKPFEVWEGTQLRDFTYVDDVVAALLQVAEDKRTNGQIYNLGGQRPISLNDLGALLVQINGGGSLTLRSFPDDRKRIDIGDYYADFRLIESQIGWKPSVSLEKGLQHTLAYYHKHISKYL